MGLVNSVSFENRLFHLAWTELVSYPAYICKLRRERTNPIGTNRMSLLRVSLRAIARFLACFQSWDNIIFNVRRLHYTCIFVRFIAASPLVNEDEHLGVPPHSSTVVLFVDCSPMTVGQLLARLSKIVYISGPSHDLNPPVAMNFLSLSSQCGHCWIGFIK